MKIINLFGIFQDAWSSNKGVNLDRVLSADSRLNSLKTLSEHWEVDLENVQRWLKSEEYGKKQLQAESFIAIAEELVLRVSKEFGRELPGQLMLAPSLMGFDGFARFDKGEHTVWFGVDHPDANLEYLKALLAHELSHVYRESESEVFRHTGKMPKELSRKEYLDQQTSIEHLVSEGLATLFSQFIFPEIEIHLHHYYDPLEMKWCFDNLDLIDSHLTSCLKNNQDVWQYYESDIVAVGSPSRTHYFWAAKKIADAFGPLSKEAYGKVLKLAHAIHSEDFKCFRLKK